MRIVDVEAARAAVALAVACCLRAIAKGRATAAVRDGPFLSD